MNKTLKDTIKRATFKELVASTLIDLSDSDQCQDMADLLESIEEYIGGDRQGTMSISINIKYKEN